jgi:hypothetical protein
MNLRLFEKLPEISFLGGAKNIPTAGGVGKGDEQNFEQFFCSPSEN